MTSPSDSNASEPRDDLAIRRQRANKPLHVYTDASAGEKTPSGNHSRIGPAYVAWAGWHCCAHPDRPTFAGTAYVGRCGTQRAEMTGVLHALLASLAYMRGVPVHRPSSVIVHMDNAPVHRVLTGEWTSGELRPLHLAVNGFAVDVVATGADLEWVKVSEKDKIHKTVHSMSKQARHQVLKSEWREAA